MADGQSRDGVVRRLLRQLTERAGRVVGRPARTRPLQRPLRQPRSARPAHGSPPPPGTPRYPGDYVGVPRVSYAPHPDGRPDPGEVVWTWVPFEEDHRVGKDRPVLLVGRDGRWLLGVGLTSRDHDGDAHRRSGHGPRWVDVGTGDWDHGRRDSEARVDRILRIHPDHIRREGAVLAAPVFARVADAIRRAARATSE